DSGVVAALATRISGRALDTFNLGFAGADVGSEHEEAARVAQHIGSRHHCLMLSPEEVLPALDRWVYVFDEPFGDQAALPTMLLAQYARREVTVVLTGEGADEVFGGYSNYVKRVREERLTHVLGARGSPLPRLARGAPPPAAREPAPDAACGARRAARPAARAPGSGRLRRSRLRGGTRPFPTSSTRCCAVTISPTRLSPPRVHGSPIPRKCSTRNAI